MYRVTKAGAVSTDWPATIRLAADQNLPENGSTANKLAYEAEKFKWDLCWTTLKQQVNYLR